MEKANFLEDRHINDCASSQGILMSLEKLQDCRTFEGLGKQLFTDTL